jgi:membrane protease YdiL (CAAX protease family)
MKGILMASDGVRLRLGWRILIVACCFVAVMVVLWLVRRLLGGGTISSLTGLALFPLLTLGAIWFAGHYIDRRAWRAFGFRFDRKWWIDFIFGLSLCLVLAGIMFVVARSLAWVTVAETFKNEKEAYKNIPFALTLIVAFVAYAGMVLWEGSLFRGYLMKNLSESLSTSRLGSRGAALLALMLSSIFFGVLHSGNPNMSLMGGLNLIVLGVFFGLPYLLTGNLALPIGLHLSWNFSQGVLFGFPVSGQMDKVAVFGLSGGGPDLWTGGEFGPEGGLMGLLAMLAGCALTILWIRISRGRVFQHPSLTEYVQLN